MNPFIRIRETLDYEVLLPACAHLPEPFATALTHLRARAMLAAERDWRHHVGDTGTGIRRRQALEEINAYRAPSPPIPLSTVYRAWAEDELDAARLISGDLPRRIVCPTLPAEQTIWITAHFGASINGATFVHATGRVTDALASDIVLSPKLPPAIKRFYARKYRALEAAFRGGRVLYYERHLKRLYRRVRQGNDLIVVTDLPSATEEASICVPLFGKKRRFAIGAAKLAAAAGIALQPYVILPDGPFRKVVLGPRIRGRRPKDFLPAYVFLADHIERRPQCWWALDLLPLMPTLTKTSRRTQ